MTTENLAEAPLPIDRHTGPEGRLDWRFLDVRLRPAARLVFEVQTTVERETREFAFTEGRTEMHCRPDGARGGHGLWRLPRLLLLSAHGEL